MIPLRLQVETDAAVPFITRLRTADTDGADDRVLERSEGGVHHFAGPGGRLAVRGVPTDDLDGDVLFVLPERRVAHRLIRAASSHNTFLVTERCDQLCVMCSQPPKDHHTDMFPVFEAAALLAPQGAVIGLSGGEPTLFKDQLLAFLRNVMEKRPDLEFQILSNAQHFEESDLAALRALDARRVLWGVPLYSADAGVHDRIVGKDGAHRRVLDNLGLLCRAGAHVELRTVVMQPHGAGLPALARLVANKVSFAARWAIMQLENIGYGRKNWRELFADTSVEFEPVGAAVDYARSRGIDAQLFNFPLCTVPEAYRHLAPSTISDWKRKYLPECADCRLREACSGFFDWHPAQHGYRRFGLA
jgi:His-Xaa-Ser system radical SAM maturase HxsC